MNLGTRSDGTAFRPCIRDECVAPAHIENCFRCAGFGEMVRAGDRATVLVTATQASRGDLPQLAVKFLRCRECGSDFRGIRGLEESKSLHVLVVDEEPVPRKALADFLEAEGHVVETAPDGIEALKKLEAADFDVVLTDIRMSRLDGPTLYRRVQERWPEHTGRIVFLSGDALTPESVEFLEEVGAVRVAKPFRPADITAALRAVIRKAAS